MDSPNSNTKNILSLDNLVFDKIQFIRNGFKNDNQLEMELEANVSQKNEQQVYKVSLNLKGNKPQEYLFEICISGYFSFIQNEEIDEDLKETLISQNTLAILMPYLRSQVSLLTAQPNVESVVLPPININGIIENQE